MIKITVCALVALSLSGCAMPPAISVASLVLDGISYVATEKSVNDHVLSEVTQSNCAMWRVVKGEFVCRDYADDEQGLLATVADAMENDLPADTATPSAATGIALADARPAVESIDQISAVDPVFLSDISPDL